MTLGRPVLCCDLLSVRDYFCERQVRYVKPGDVEDLATALRQLLSDPDLRRQLATEAASFYDRYNWSAEERAYLSIVESMIEANAERNDGPLHRSIA